MKRIEYLDFGVRKINKVVNNRQTPEQEGVGILSFPPSSTNNYGAWRNYISKLVGRYKQGGTLAQSENWGNTFGIKYWEIWNEVDSSHYWKVYDNPKDHIFSSISVRATKYAELLKATNNAAKQEDISCKIMTSIARADRATPKEELDEGKSAEPIVVPNRPWENGIKFIEQLYQARNNMRNLPSSDWRHLGLTEDLFDFINVHAYRYRVKFPGQGSFVKEHFSDGPTKGPLDEDDYYHLNFEGELNYLKGIMDSHGDNGKKVWLGELGWPRGQYYSTDDEISTYLQQAYNIASKLSYVGTASWFCLFGNEEYGLTSKNYYKYPSYNAYKEIAVSGYPYNYYSSLQTTNKVSGINGVQAGDTVKIYTISGSFVKEFNVTNTNSYNGWVLWNGLNSDNEKVASTVFLYNVYRGGSKVKGASTAVRDDTSQVVVNVFSYDNNTNQISVNLSDTQNSGTYWSGGYFTVNVISLDGNLLNNVQPWSFKLGGTYSYSCGSLPAGRYKAEVIAQDVAGNPVVTKSIEFNTYSQDTTGPEIPQTAC